MAEPRYSKCSEKMYTMLLEMNHWLYRTMAGGLFETRYDMYVRVHKLLLEVHHD